MSNQRDTSVDIAIVGGGMAGLSMALALAPLNLKVMVIDKSPLALQHLPEFDGRVSAIALGSQRMLHRLGLWQELAPHAEAINDIRVSDGQSPFFLHYDHREVGDEPFGWIVENRYTRKALFDAVSAAPNITLRTASIKSLLQTGDKPVLTLQGGEEITADLVIGADGKFSKLRELAGIAYHHKHYKQTALVCTIQHELPHHGLAQERFLGRGPFAVLPMQDNRSSLVWVEPEHLAKHYTALDNKALGKEIEKRVGGYLGALKVEGKLFTYPLSLGLAESFSAGKVVLIGDAAHSIHPIAGQGINLGFRDVAVLAELFERQTGAGKSIADASVMLEYARWRRLDTLAMAGMTDALNRLFSNHILPVKLARGLGLFAVSKIPALKKQLMRHAMGASGDLPALMRP